MQTFLPETGFAVTAKILDYKRLGKQRVEAYQIINILTGQTKSKAWINHPAVKMWRGHVTFLQLYYNNILSEWARRGFKNNMKPFWITLSKDTTPPPWLGMEKFHSSHRAALLFKDFNWYSKYGWKETPEINYYWPV